MIERVRGWIWDATTSIVADTIALWSPRAAAEYRHLRGVYRRTYTAASTKGPHQLWRPSNRSGNAEVGAASPAVRAKVRDLSRNNPLVAGMKLKRATMVVGDEIGIKCQSRGPDGKPLKALNQDLESRFYRWAEAAGVDHRSLTELVQLGENHSFDDGEHLVVETLRPQPDGSNPFRLMLLEPDYLDSSKGTYGVEYDADGNPLVFHLYNAHPGDGVSVTSKPTRALDPATGLMIHLIAETDRASQRRGISQLAPSVMRLYQVDDLMDAELVASRAACAYGLVVKSAIPGGITQPWTNDGSTTDSPEDDNGKKRGYLEAGGILELDPGEDAIAFKNERPNSNFDGFVRLHQRSGAGAAGMSFESATGDYSQVNYSSARMGRVIEWMVCRRRQKKIMRLLTRIYRVWLRYEMLAAPIAGVNLQDNRTMSPVWQLAGNDGFDPVKEIDAAERGVTLGTTSRSRFCSDRGGDFAEIAGELAEEMALLKELGLWQEDPTVNTSGFQEKTPGKQPKEPTTDEEVVGDDDDEQPPKK